MAANDPVDGYLDQRISPEQYVQAATLGDTETLAVGIYTAERGTPADKKASAASFEVAAKAHACAPALVVAGRRALVLGRLDAAVECFELGLSRAPRWHPSLGRELLVHLADAENARGNAARAVCAASTALRVDPLNPFAVRAFGVAAARLGRVEDALSARATLASQGHDEAFLAPLDKAIPSKARSARAEPLVDAIDHVAAMDAETVRAFEEVARYDGWFPREHGLDVAAVAMATRRWSLPLVRLRSGSRRSRFGEVLWAAAIADVLEKRAMRDGGADERLGEATLGGSWFSTPEQMMAVRWARAVDVAGRDTTKRGAPLVARCLAVLRLARSGAAQPLAAASLDRLEADVGALPVSLRAVLAVDAAWSRLVGPAGPAFRMQPLRAVLAPTDAAITLSSEAERFFAAAEHRAILVGGEHALLLGPLDALGERPILAVRDDVVTVGWAGFDAYLADMLGVEYAGPAHEKARAALAKALFGQRGALDLRA